MVQDTHQAQLRQVDDGMNIKVILGRLVLAGEQCGPEDGAGTSLLVGENDVAAKVVPAQELAQGDHAADALRLAVANTRAGSGVHLAHREAAGHNRPRSRARASSGRAPATHRWPDGQWRGAGRKSRRSTTWL